MKTPGIRTLLASASLLALTAGPGSSAYGNFGTGRPAVYAPVETVLPVATSYVVPTTFALSTTSYVAPTSYVVPSSYVLPSSYVYPTSYLATSTVAPSVYSTVYESATYVPSSYVVPTSYVYRPRPILAPRRWVERPVYASTTSLYVPTTTRLYTPTTYYATSYSLRPTTYVYPTFYDAPVIATVATADACCLESAATRPAAPAPTSGTTPAPANTLKRAPARPSTVESTVASPEERRAEPPAEAAAPAPAPTPAPVAPAETKPEPETLPPPASLPVAPEAPEERSTAPPVEKLPLPAGPESKDVIPPPLAPADGTTPPAPQVPTAPGGETTERRLSYPIDSNVRLSRAPSAGERYSVNRPTYESEKLRQAGNILKGKVRSGDTGELEEGVQVILTSRTNAFAERVIATDAYGRYAIRLPDGDWIVKVVMPSGRAYVVRELTITGDRITDDLGRNVPSLTITR